MNQRYEVRRLPEGEFILWDQATSSRVEMVGPWESASEATRRCGYYNKAWEALPTLLLQQASA